MLLAKRLLGALLVLAGLALAAAGGWFVGLVGTDGTVTFTLRPTTAAPVVLEPSLLNRLTVPSVVRVTPAAGQTVWVGTGSGADADAAIGRGRVVRATGVDVRRGTLEASAQGTGPVAGLTSADVWRQQEDSTGVVTWTVAQGQSPDTLVVAGDEGVPVAEVSVSWTRSSWFFQALVLTLVGLLVLGVGVLVLVASLRRRPGAGTEPAAEDAAVDGPEVRA